MREPAFDAAGADRQQSELQWQQFTATGSVYDYLDYLTCKARLAAGQGKANHANGNDRSGAAPGEGGRSGPDPDAVDP